MWNYIRQIQPEDMLPTRKLPKWIAIWIVKIKKWIGYSQVKKIEDDKYLYLLPEKKMTKKIEENKNTCVLSKALKQVYQKENGQIGVQSKQAYQYSLEKTFQYIIRQLGDKELTLETMDLYFLTNQYQKETIEIIEYFLEKVKTMNVITKNVQNYIKLEEKWEKEKGILITVSNNKKKSLKKAKWIINLDFEVQQLKSYSIFRNAIIFNMTTENITKLPAFEGIMVNQLEILVKAELQEEWKEKGLDTNVFDRMDLYETCVKRQDTYAQNVRKVEENEVKVVNLIGNNGRIPQKELLGKKIFLTN